MNTTFWGPSGWVFLHTLTFIYPETPSYTDKVAMQNFMNSISYILPCKYCRISFTKYSSTLPIIDYLDTRDKVIEWLYKMHNKVNKKLRGQGFCNYSNPDLSLIKDNYKPILEHIHNLFSSHHKSVHTIQTIITYICNLGRDFLASIVFNYQGYFSNCYSGDEKMKIVSVYHTFFNSIIPLICSYISKMNIKMNTEMSTEISTEISIKCSEFLSRYKTNHSITTLFNIKNILSQTEAYSKLIKWFYNCKLLCSFDDKVMNSFDKYMTYYSKHIVLSCSNNIDKTKIKSCRKNVKKSTKKNVKKL
jgi:hypothetical protein